jgi:choice-of-anchor B domain-containing protein
MPLRSSVRSTVLAAFPLAVLAAGAAAQVSPASSGVEGLVGLRTPPPSRAEASDLAAIWTGAPRWLTGVDWQGEAFFGGLARGRNFLFASSTIGPEGDVPVEIRFDSTETTLTGIFLCCSGGSPSLPGVFRGSAWDVSDPLNPRRLNVIIAENDGLGVANGLWDPDASPFGKNEFLYVMASDYDGTGLTYEGAEQRDPLDVLYVLAARLSAGETLYASSPATLLAAPALVREFAAEAGNGTARLGWRYTEGEGAGFAVWRRTEGVEEETRVALLPLSARRYEEGGLSEDSLYAYRLEVVDAAGDPLHLSTQVFVRPLVSRGLSLVGRLDPRSTYGDVWGYVAPDGREYALLTASTAGLSVIDVTAEPPVEVAFVPTAPGAFDTKDVETWGHHAYVVNEYGPIQIVDLTDPASPVQVGLLDTQPGVADGGTHTLSIVDGYLYAQGGRDPGGVRIFSLADPANPTLVGAYEPSYVHDVLVRNDTLYAARIYGEGVDIVDVSDKTNPALIASFTYPGNGPHNVCATESGAYVFVGDEIGSAGRWTRVFDVRDPENATLVAELVVDPNAVVHNCNVEGDLLYLAHYTEGVRVWDVSDPTRPYEVGFYDTYGPLEYGFYGVWTVYPYLPSGKLIASDMQTGLWVLRLDTPVGTEPPPEAPAPLVIEIAPNPSREAVTLTFRIAEAAEARLTVHDALGRQVAVAAAGAFGVGEHAVRFDMGGLPSGLYLARLEADGRAALRRFTRLR